MKKSLFINNLNDNKLKRFSLMYDHGEHTRKYLSKLLEMYMIKDIVKQ